LKIYRSVLKEIHSQDCLPEEKNQKKKRNFLSRNFHSICLHRINNKNNPSILYISNDGNDNVSLSLLPPSKCLTCTCSMLYKPTPVYLSSNKCGNCTVLMEIYGMKFCVLTEKIQVTEICNKKCDDAFCRSVFLRQAFLFLQNKCS